MAARNNRQPVRPKLADPDRAGNDKLLADRRERLDAQRKELPELGLDLKEPAAAPEPETAAEFMDQFEKQAFGYAEATITKIIWGPDPLVDNSPAFRDALDKYGRQDLAGLYQEAILKNGAAAMPDPLMAKALLRAIDKFGREAVAQSFAERILRIPFREVEIDASDEPDPDVLGSAVLGETVRRYQRHGMEYRFFTQLCVDRMGWRGYTPVKDKGDIVRCGTLMLGEIRRETVEKRRLKRQMEAREKLEGIVDSFEAQAEATLMQAAAEGLKTQGISALPRGDVLNANRAGGDDPDGYLGRSRSTGLEFTREEQE